MLEVVLTRKNDPEEEALALARKMLLSVGSAPLVKIFQRAGKGNAALEGIATKMRITGEVDEVSLQRLKNPRLAELIRIIGVNAERGSDASRPLSILASRLEREIRARRRFKAKTAGMQALTQLGMGFFFPLFAGISSTILNSSLGLFAGGKGAEGRGFLVVAACYIPIILYLSSAFSHPERQVLQNLLSIAPYFAFSLLVLLATSTFLSGIL